MRIRQRTSFDILSISALDLFASALGVFMLLALLMFPYWLKQPALQEATAAAGQQLAAAEDARGAAESASAAAREQQAEAAAALAQAQQRLAAAEAEAAAAEAAAARAQAARAAEAPAAAPTPAPVPAVATPPARRRSGIGIGPLDLVIVMDTTGSMRDEVEDVQASLLGTIRVLDRLSSSLRVGFVAYKDRGEDYLTRVWPLTPVSGSDAGGILGFVRGLTVGGGGDEPEPVDDALAVAVALPWRPDAQGRILVVGDAAARPGGTQRAFQLARQFRARAPRFSVGTVFTGLSGDDRSFFRELADVGGGDFSQYRGTMIESVLMSVLEKPGRPGAR